MLPTAPFPDDKEGSRTPPGYLGNDISKATAVPTEPGAWQALEARIIYVGNLCQHHIWG